MTSLFTLEARKLGFVDVTEDQCYVVKQFIKGSDLFVSLPTGSGKSLCYWLLPGLCDTFRGKVRIPSVGCKSFSGLDEKSSRLVAKKRS